MRPIDAEGFERKFTASDDPWACRSSRGEALKRRRAFAGLPLVSCALDVACGDGAGTRDIAARAMRVDAIDRSAAALASAARLIGDDRRVRYHLARLPGQIPRGAWRRVVLSEVIYYLAPHEIDRLGEALALRLPPGGVLISIHHVVPFGDVRTPPARALAVLKRRLGRRLRLLSSQRHGPYDITHWQRAAKRTGALTRTASA